MAPPLPPRKETRHRPPPPERPPSVASKVVKQIKPPPDQSPPLYPPPDPPIRNDDPTLLEAQLNLDFVQSLSLNMDSLQDTGPKPNIMSSTTEGLVPVSSHESAMGYVSPNSPYVHTQAEPPVKPVASPTKMSVFSKLSESIPSIPCDTGSTPRSIISPVKTVPKAAGMLSPLKNPTTLQDVFSPFDAPDESLMASLPPPITASKITHEPAIDKSTELQPNSNSAANFDGSTESPKSGNLETKSDEGAAAADTDDVNIPEKSSTTVEDKVVNVLGGILRTLDHF